MDEALQLIEDAIKECSGRSLVDADTMVNHLLDIRQAVLSNEPKDLLLPAPA